MIFTVLSVFDVKAAVFSPPFYAPTLAHGIRSFGDAVSSAESLLSKHPSDYMCFNLGTFDDASGLLCSSTPVMVSKAVDFVQVSAMSPS